MPEGYDLDYLLHSASSSAQEQDYIEWNWSLSKVVKKAMFVKFDSYVKEQYFDAIKDRKNG